MKTIHSTLTSAMLSVESLVSQGHSSFKVWREDSQWYVQTPVYLEQNLVNGETNEQHTRNIPKI